MDIEVPLRAPGRRVPQGLARVLRTAAPLVLMLVLSLSSRGQIPTPAPGLPSAPSTPAEPTQTGTRTQTTSGTPRQQTSRTAAETLDATRSDTDDPSTRETRERAANIPQAAPTAFQLLVQESTGNLLPIFGASLFDNVPSTFAPVRDIPVSPDYVIGPGDELRIQVYGAINQQATLVVDRTGNISYADVGSIHVAGIRYSQLEGFLKSQLGRVYRNFELNVNLGQLRSIQVFVFGAARRPGAYTVSSLSTLLNALFASGGVLPQGSLRTIQLLRDNKVVTQLDLYELLLHGDKSHDAALQPGDIIFIPPVVAQVAVSGSVNNPAIYEILPGTTVSQLLQLAGGDTSVALGTRVRLERIFEHTMRDILDVDVAVKDPQLMAGDVVSVGVIQDRYKDAVTLRGNVTFPGRYVWHAGMRIQDLVPTREQLLTPDYFRRRNALGNPLPRPDPAGSLQVHGDGESRRANDATVSGAATVATNGGSSVGEALTSSNQVFPASTDVFLSAPDIDLSYAVIERLDAKTLMTLLIPFNPGKLYLQGDQSQNLELLSGDVVTFFSTADIRVPAVQQTRFVRLEGEFTASGLYSVEPGETLRHLLARAGGFTPDAYLYGSEFTRISTRRLQQQRLNEFADNLEAQVSLFSSAANARATSTQDALAAAASSDAALQTVARLRRVVPLGRIVLQVRPDSRGVDTVPDIPLEDGDRFIVPRVPSTVSVAGEVYSANAFVFERNRREHDYLRQAGGPARDADAKRTFILRADGSVYSSQYGDVAKAHMFPGDTVVVPPKIQRTAFLRNVVDISNIIGQLGIGVAAITLLR